MMKVEKPAKAEMEKPASARDNSFESGEKINHNKSQLV